MHKSKSFFLFLIVVLIGISAFSQEVFTGKIVDANGAPLAGANITLEPGNFFGVTDLNGVFQINGVTNGTYDLTITFLGAKTIRQSVAIEVGAEPLQITLEEDPLNLQNVVVTGNFEPRTQLGSITAITTLNSRELHQNFPRGTANILQSIPGTFTDASAGEVFTKVYSRGISASAEDDMGWYYVSLQEDGLPVSLVQHSYYSPDLFYRYDLTTEKLEAIRGGSAVITALNAPGGIYNFISRAPRDQLGGEVELQGGLQGDGNPLYRIDGTLGGP
ncbi:MAG: TonB-dependent receptor, partial [Maribacter sp.]|nr:TonB-dependent receptor [Maribacter sp.]